ncbi:MAG: hypothetical protein QOE86_945, partial [Solirubrobacteraceae bacterium]|nr:hypothetical protein [Solirubrobacteraceae bacterium]
MTDLAASDQQVAAQLIERLLTDPAFRTRFRRDPAKACREAGLDALANEMSLAPGGAMMTLEVRESRSSLAGVMMAAAMEGVGVYEFTKHVVPHLEDAASSIGEVLSHVNLPAIQAVLPDLGGGGGGAGSAALLPDGLPPGVGDGGGAGGASGAAAAAVDQASAAPAPPPAPAGGADASLPTATAASSDAPVPEPAADATLPSPTDLPSAGSVSDANLPEGSAPVPVAHAAAAVDATAGGGGGAEPVPNPDQYGMAGSGGPPSLEAKAVLANANITLDANGKQDFSSGRIDPRLAAVMLK